jgi:biopolymer transport protein ExbD
MRPSRLAAVKLDLTPLIDVVFQLLIFFVLTFRIVEAEGEFQITLPSGGRSGATAPLALPLEVRLRAGPAGALAEVQLAGRRLSGLEELHREIERLLGSDAGLAAVSEANLVCDPCLAYEHCLAAVAAVSGTMDEDGAIRPLIGRIRFSEPR